MARLIGSGMGVVAGAITQVDTAARNPVGTRSLGDDGNEYIYLGGVASLAAGDWVHFNSATYIPVRLVTAATLAGPVAVAMSAALAAQFGWFQIYGLVLVANIATTTGTALLSVNTTATPGRVSGATVAATSIQNAAIVTTSVANVGQAFISYPFTLGVSTL